MKINIVFLLCILLVPLVSCVKTTSEKESYLVEICSSQNRYEDLNEIGTMLNLKKLEIVCDDGGWVIYPPLSAIPSNPKFNKTSELEVLPFDVSNLKKLEHLKFQMLGLDELPVDIISLQNLKTLDISFNNIDILKDTGKFEMLSQLEVLTIVGNEYDEAKIKKWARNQQFKVVFDFHELMSEYSSE